MTSDLTSDPFGKYPAREDWDPALSPLARVDRAHRRLLLAQATEGEARALFWGAVNAALDADATQAEIVRKTGYSREAIRLNRRPGSGNVTPPEPTKAAEPTSGRQGTVTFDLEEDEHADFVLTDALREWAHRQRGEAENELADDPEDTTAAHRLEWAKTADNLLGRIEAAL